MLRREPDVQRDQAAPGLSVHLHAHGDEPPEPRGRPVGLGQDGAGGQQPAHQQHDGGPDEGATTSSVSTALSAWALVDTG